MSIKSLVCHDKLLRQRGILSRKITRFKALIDSTIPLKLNFQCNSSIFQISVSALYFFAETVIPGGPQNICSKQMQIYKTHVMKSFSSKVIFSDTIKAQLQVFPCKFKAIV